MNALLFAIQFLTRLPIPVSYHASDQAQQQSLYWHGVVGLVISALLWIAAGLFQWLFGPAPLLLAALLLVVWVVITGALHLDGLGDSADAWLGGYGDKQKTLAIMKDPTSGPAAIVWISLVLIIKLAALTTLLQNNADYALLMAPVIARLGCMCLFVTTPYVREQGIASVFAKGINAQWIYLQCAIVLAAMWLCLGWQSVMVLLFVAATWWYARHLMMSRIAGTTGDTAGALIEWLEAVTLLGLCVSRL